MDYHLLARLYVFFVSMLLFEAITNGNFADGDWVDPKDMLRYNSMTQTMSKEKNLVSERQVDKLMVENEAQLYFSSQCNPLKNPCADVKRCCPPCPTNSVISRPTMTGKDDRSVESKCRESLFVTRYVKRLLYLFDRLNDESSTSFSVDVTLTQHDLDRFKRYVTSKGSIQDVEEILSRMMTNVDSRSWIKEMKETLIFEEWISFVQKNVIYLVSCVGILLTVRSIIKNRWYKSVCQLFVILFAISIVWELQHQYLKADAKKRMSRQRFSEIPKECNPEKLTYWEYLASLFNNRCEEYYEAMIDSYWEVNPFMAAVSVLTRALPLFGSGLGGSVAEYFGAFRNYFSFWELTYMIPLATLILVVFIMYPCSSGLTAYITSRPIRQMVEDVNDDGGRQRRQQQQQLAQPREVQIVEQHHHYYQIQSGNCGKGSATVSCDEPTGLSCSVCAAKKIREIHRNCSSVEELESSKEIRTTASFSENGECSLGETKFDDDRLQNRVDYSEDKVKSE